MNATLGICLALGAAAGAADLPPPPPAAPARVPGARAPVRATAASAVVFVPARRFTLAWMHSIEHVRWEEDYELHAAGEGGRADTALSSAAAAGAPPQLWAVSSRVRGSAAGMEPGPDAVLRGGWFEFRPAQGVHTDLWLTRSPYTADYELCVDGAACQPLSAWLPSDGWRTRLWPCRG